MRPKDIRAVLESMVLLVDTREQDTVRLRDRLRGMDVQRAPLDYGDYTYNARLPSGEWIHDITGRVYPPCAIERKMDLDELAQCLTASRDRFGAELRRAEVHRARLWLLVEDASWTGIMEQRYRTRMTANAYMGSVLAMMTRHDVHVLMCSQWDTGQLIRRILRWELKERLEGGEYG